MPANRYSLYVTLDESTNPPSLTVADSAGKIPVTIDPDPQKIPEPREISWELIGVLASGIFNKLEDPDAPGFAWLDTPKPGIFGKPDRHGAGTIITIRDVHTGYATHGTWKYQLCVTFKKKPYTTHRTLGALGNTDPTIKNNYK